MNRSGFSFSVSRLFQLSRISMSDDWRSFLLTGLVMGGLVFISGLLWGQPSVDFFFSLMLVIGVVLVSKLFAGIYKKEKGIYLFMLPASVEEKFAVQLIASLIGFYLYAFLTIAAGATLYNLVASFTNNARIFAITSPQGLWAKFQVYAFFHAMFFTGSLMFKRNNFLKTSLVLVGIIILLIVLSFTYLSYIKDALFSAGHSQIIFQFNGFDQLIRFFGIPSFSTSYHYEIIALIIIPLMLYGISYYKYKNSQVKG